jgi:hypothetical protein
MSPSDGLTIVLLAPGQMLDGCGAPVDVEVEEIVRLVDVDVDVAPDDVCVAAGPVVTRLGGAGKITSC